MFDDRPVEFWPTAAIRAALETDDLAVWQRIVAAIKRDPFGRTARQVEEVLETARPYGLSKALTEVLSRTREHMEANERAEV
ncbi:XRE family transcriptional regulator, partial [Mycolicibacterium elephantis]